MIVIEAVIGISLTVVDCENQRRRGGRVAEGGGLLMLPFLARIAVSAVLPASIDPIRILLSTSVK